MSGRAGEVGRTGGWGGGGALDGREQIGILAGPGDRMAGGRGGEKGVWGG